MPGRVFHLIPHTHWDREWYLTRAAFVARLVPMVDDLIARLEADPAFTSFLLDGQTIHLADYLRVRPERAEAVRALVRSGRLQTGPWYVLADELIPSGESLIRNLLIGSAEAAALGGRSEALYSPDAFGHPAVWPSLAREFGLGAGALWRGRRGASDLFRWRARDGAEIVVYHLPPAGYEIGGALPADSSVLPRQWRSVREVLASRAGTRHVAVFVGADHHAAHPDLPALRQMIATIEADRDPAGEVRISRLDEFLAAAALEARDLPLVDGELRDSAGYTWSLQGVHGTRAPLKRRNAVAELWLQRFAEPLAMLARRAAGRDRGALLMAAWQDVVQSQFHDTIGGCSADAVAREARLRLDAAIATAREITRASLGELVGYDADRSRERKSQARPALVCWNPAARSRQGVAIAEVTFFRRDVLVGPPSGRSAGRGAGAMPFAFRTADGMTIPVQVLEQDRALERIDAPRHYPDLDEVDRVRVAFQPPALPGLGVATLEVQPSASVPAGDAQLVGTTIRNDLLAATLETNGTLTLEDRASGARYAGLLQLESEGDAGDTYTYAPVPGSRRTAAGPMRIRAVAAGPLAASVEGSTAFAGARVRIRLILLAGERFVRCLIDLDNGARNRRLRLRLPTGVTSDVAVAGTAFGAVHRSAAPAAGSTMEAAVATAPAHRWAGAARDGRGLAVIAPGFFEYEWTGRDLLVTLLRSVGDLSRGDLATRPGHAGWVTPVPEAQCIGRDHIELAVGPCDARELAETERMEERWEDAFLPVRGMWLRDAEGLTIRRGAVELEGEGLVMSAVKPAANGAGAVIRCWNARDTPVAGCWRVTPPPSHAERTRGDERLGEAATLAADGSISFQAGPGEIVSFRIR